MATNIDRFGGRAMKTHSHNETDKRFHNREWERHYGIRDIKAPEQYLITCYSCLGVGHDDNGMRCDTCHGKKTVLWNPGDVNVTMNPQSG